MSIFVCGWECNQTGPGTGSTATRHWNTASGAPTIVTSPTRGAHSARALKTTTAASAAIAAKKTITGAAHVVLRVYLYFDSALPSANCALIDFFANLGGSPQLRYRSSDSKLIMTDGTTTQVGPTVTTGVWYRVDIHSDQSANPNLWYWQIDGVAYTTFSLAQVADTTTQVTLGVNVAGSTSAATASVLWDDLIISTTSGDYPFGDGKVYGYLPASDGTHSFNAGDGTDFKKGTIGSLGNAASSDTDLYQSVDNVPGSNTTAISADGPEAGEYVEIRFAQESSETGTPRAVELVASFRNVSATTANKHSGRLNDGVGTADLWTDISLGTASIATYGYHQSAPPGGGGWTVALLNALRFRWGGSWTGTPDVSPIPYFTAAMVEAEFQTIASAAPNRTLKSALTIARQWIGGWLRAARPQLGIIPGVPRKTILGRIPITRPWMGFGKQTGPKTGTTPAAQVSPHRTILGAIAIARMWPPFARLVRPAIRGALVTGAPTKTIRGAVPITRPWVGTDRVFTHALGGLLTPGRTTRAAGLPAPARPWTGSGRLARGQTGTTPPATGAPRTTVHGQLPITRPWMGTQRVSRAQSGTTPPATGAPRTTLRAQVPITRRWTGTQRTFRAQPGSTPPVVTLGPRPTLHAGVPITRVWTPANLRILKPAQGRRTELHRTIRGAVPITRPWTGTDRVFTHARGLGFAPHRTVIGRTPIVRPWTGTQRLFTHAKGGRLINGSTAFAGISLTRTQQRWFGGVVQTGATYGIIPGAPRKTILGAIAITWPWHGTNRLFKGQANGAPLGALRALLSITAALRGSGAIVTALDGTPMIVPALAGTLEIDDASAF